MTPPPFTCSSAPPSPSAAPGAAPAERRPRPRRRLPPPAEDAPVLRPPSAAALWPAAGSSAAGAPPPGGAVAPLLEASPERQNRTEPMWFQSERFSHCQEHNWGLSGILKSTHDKTRDGDLNSDLFQQSLQTSDLLHDGCTLCWIAVLLPGREEKHMAGQETPFTAHLNR